MPRKTEKKAKRVKSKTRVVESAEPTREKCAGSRRKVVVDHMVKEKGAKVAYCPLCKARYTLTKLDKVEVGRGLCDAEARIFPVHSREL